MNSDILTELHNQGKQLTLYKVLAHIGIKGNEEPFQAAKQAIDMTTTRLGTLNGKRNGKTALVSYAILNHALKNWKVHTIAVGNKRSD